jgi:glycosyltransferase involved in cell wall biosynthesis
MKVLMLLANAYGPDPRVQKEARALSGAGHDVQIIAWDRLGTYDAETMEGPVRIRRIRVASTFGRGIGQLPVLARVLWAFRTVARHADADVIHCHDLDTLPAGVLAVVFRRHKPWLVYDSHENFPVQKSAELPRLALPILASLEWICVQFVDRLITASSVLAKEFSARYHKPVTLISNFAPKEAFVTTSVERESLRKSLGYGPPDIVIAYIGGLRPARVIIPMIRAVSERPGIGMFICGEGEQRQEIERLCSETANVRYLGSIPQSQVIPYYVAADAVYYALKDYPGARYNAPNNFSYALLAGSIIIGSDVGDLGVFIRESGCGLLLSGTDEKTLGEAVDRLLDDRDALDRMKQRALEAGATRYHWGVMEHRLTTLYRELD